MTEQARLAGLAWERLPDPKPQLTLGIYFSTGQEHVFYLGPHAPHLTPREIDLLHNIWLALSNELAPEEIHHNDIVHFALQELRRDFDGSKRQEIVGRIRRHVQNFKERRVPRV